MPHLCDRRPGRPWRSALPCIAGALRRSLLAGAAGAAVAFGPEAPGSIPCRRRPGFHQPPGLSADASTGTRPVHSPFFVMWPGGWQAGRRASSGRGIGRRRGRRERLESRATQDRQVRIAREPRVRTGAFAQPVRAALRLDDPGLTAAGAQPDACEIRRSGHEYLRSWRRGWDSNPRSLSTQRFSRAPPSTARPPLRGQDISDSVVGQSVGRTAAGLIDRRGCRKNPGAGPRRSRRRSTGPPSSAVRDTARRPSTGRPEGRPRTRGAEGTGWH